MKKYPVVSRTGQNYLVDITEDDYGCYVVSVYIKKAGWIRKEKLKRVSGGYFEGRYPLADWGFDLIAMACQEVEKYEKRLQDNTDFIEKKKNAVKAFINWDGKLK